MIDPAKLRFIAYGAKDTFTFDHPVEFELVKSYDSPAQSLEAVFPCEQAMKILRGLGWKVWFLYCKLVK